MLREAYAGRVLPARLSLDGREEPERHPSRRGRGLAGPRRRQEAAFRAAVESATAVVRDAYAKQPDAGATVTVEGSRSTRRRRDSGRRARPRCSTSSRSCRNGGPLAMSPDFDGLVETSTSLGEAATEGGCPHAAQPVALVQRRGPARGDRSARRGRARRRRQRWRSSTTTTAGAPTSTRICSSVARSVYERLFGKPPVVSAIHAGLETAVIGNEGQRPTSTCWRSARRSRGRIRPTSE